MHHFEELVTSEMVARVKPAPELYEKALKLLNLRADEALAVEDSPHGVTAARAAGLFCVAVPGPMTRGCEFHEAHAVLDSFTDRTLGDVLVELGVAV
jgi:putative hydrolase of the HAD superfamily